jgi:hypothetical protein
VLTCDLERRKVRNEEATCCRYPKIGKRHPVTHLRPGVFYYGKDFVGLSMHNEVATVVLVDL